MRPRRNTICISTNQKMINNMNKERVEDLKKVLKAALDSGFDLKVVTHNRVLTRYGCYAAELSLDETHNELVELRNPSGDYEGWFETCRVNLSSVRRVELFTIHLDQDKRAR